SASYAGIELYIALEVVAFGYVLQIAKHFWLLGITFGPFPFLQQLLVPGEAVKIGVGIRTRSRIAVPVPSPADGFAVFIYTHVSPQSVAQGLQHVHAGKARADDHSVEVLN